MWYNCYQHWGLQGGRHDIPQEEESPCSLPSPKKEAKVLEGGSLQFLWIFKTYTILLKFGRDIFLIHFLSENAKKIGGHHVGFQDGADQSSLDYTRNFAQVFSINSAGWKAMNFWVRSNIWASTIIVPEMILRAFLALAIVLQVKLPNTIFGCLWHNGPTWANLGQMYLYDFDKIFTNVYMGISFEKMRKKLGVTMLVKEW